MLKRQPTDREMGVTEFKPRCLAAINDVAHGRVSRIILTRHGRPVAAIVPADDAAAEAWASLRGQAVVSPDFDPDQ